MCQITLPCCSVRDDTIRVASGAWLLLILSWKRKCLMRATCGGVSFSQQLHIKHPTVSRGVQSLSVCVCVCVCVCVAVGVRKASL